jgi:hypothetical protein
MFVEISMVWERACVSNDGICICICLFYVVVAIHTVRIARFFG